LPKKISSSFWLTRNTEATDFLSGSTVSIFTKLYSLKEEKCYKSKLIFIKWIILPNASDHGFSLLEYGLTVLNAFFKNNEIT
jgi:hypothetical protein